MPLKNPETVSYYDMQLKREVDRPVRRVNPVYLQTLSGFFMGSTRGGVRGVSVEERFLLLSVIQAANGGLTPREIIEVTGIPNSTFFKQTVEFRKARIIVIAQRGNRTYPALTPLGATILEGLQNLGEQSQLVLVDEAIEKVRDLGFGLTDEFIEDIRRQVIAGGSQPESMPLD